MLIGIEISQVETGRKVWFGTWTKDGSQVFATAEEAVAFAKAKFAKMKKGHIIYPKGWPLAV